MNARVSIFLGAMAALIAAPAYGQIANSDHDFSNVAWANNEICLPCHTPHHADTNVSFLWNHELTVAVFTMYDGSTSNAGGANSFQQASRLCLSCHDGTVATDSFGGQSGSNFISGNALIGTDLQDDHPIGNTAIYPTGGDADFNAAAGGAGNWAVGGLPLTDFDPGTGLITAVGCESCHSVHDDSNGKFLRIDNNASALCLTCHIK